MTGPMATLRTLRYEAARLARTRSTRGAVLVALAVAALLTLPAARSLGALTSRPGAAASVVAGGTVGAAVPAAAACLVAAWLGATSIVDEYRYGRVLYTYALLPKRGAVLFGKMLAAAAFGVVLCLLANLAAYGTARLGFTLASVRTTVPLRLMLPAAITFECAALAGALGVLAALVLRFRGFATVLALVGPAMLAASVPHSASPLKRYLDQGVSLLDRYAPHVPPLAVPTTAAALLLIAAYAAVRLRRAV